MVFNRFTLYLIIRLVIILGLMIALSGIFMRTDLFFTQIILFGSILVGIYDLIRFINRTNIELSRFIDAINNEDFSASFSSLKYAPSFKHLNQSFSGLIEILKKQETDKAAQLHFLNKLIDQIEFGIITLTDNDNIELINQQASDLLQIPRISEWKNLRNENIKFLKQILDLEEEKNQLIESYINGQPRIFSVNCSHIKIKDQLFKIVTFKDIRSEIQQKEIEAWHKMIRILTHEIMNSVTPLVSLIETLEMMLTSDQEPKKAGQLEDEQIADMTYAVRTIKERSAGILQFVKDYRKLTRIPKPEFSPTSIKALVDRVVRLQSQELKDHQIEISTEIPDLEINLDAHLIEQVLINLLKNAIEALNDTKNPGNISISLRKEPDKMVLIVSDNGPGIVSEKLDKVFVPFYTSKKYGSGIGLALSRQILSLHGGTVEVVSVPDIETSFYLSFPV